MKYRRAPSMRAPVVLRGSPVRQGVAGCSGAHVAVHEPFLRDDELPHASLPRRAAGQSGLELFAVGDEDDRPQGALGLVSPGPADETAAEEVLDTLLHAVLVPGVVSGRPAHVGEDDLPELGT
ncbi:uncharacterized protein PG986_006265 [Apiospora aurea]|uniref:GAF domain-containing protein n=1 Tax=Apiospora aurea TaxID=335848 RepID=A0ABR1QK93_9PEZI